MRQTSFIPKMKLHFGGKMNEKKRKNARPFSHTLPMHIVMRSTQATGDWSMLLKEHDLMIQRLLKKYKELYQINVYGFANVGNHLHLLIKTEARSFYVAQAQFKSFLRRFAGEVAFNITGARKSHGLKKRFWDTIPFSRLVHWGRAYQAMKDYILKNLFEGAGLWNRKRDSELQIIDLSLREAGMPPPQALYAEKRARILALAA